MENASFFFGEYIEETPKVFFSLAQSGSSRVNFVGESANQKFIITYNENLAENESFLYFSDVFSTLKLNTPKIFKISDDQKMYIQEFLGNNTLSEIIENEGLSKRVKSLVKKTLIKLHELQIKTENKIDYSKTFEYEAYDEIPVSYDLFYFKFMFADIFETEYHKTKLLKEFKKIEKLIESLEPKGLMIRDFQARNIMINDDDDVFFIDYQSAMKGPLMYDVISFLYQAKANFPENFRQEMLQFYYALWNDKKIEEQLKSALKPLQLMRFLQVLGVYGFRGLVQKKPHFIKSIEKGVDNLYEFSQNWEQMKDFPELENVIIQLNAEKSSRKIEELNH